MNSVGNELEKLLSKVEGEIKGNSAYQADVKKWIATYIGKIIGFQVGDDSFYFVFGTGGDFEIQTGQYPSCDAFFNGSYEDIENILLGDDDPKNLINQSRLLFYGNYNEFVSFRSLYS